MLKNKKIFIASFWVILIFGLSQVLRLGSNLVLTRLLEPEVFGVMAVVSVVMFGITMFTDLGLWAFVVRHKTPDDPHVLNVVWTLHVVRGVFVFLLISFMVTMLYLGNQYIPEYFHGIYTDPRLPILISIASLGALIAGCKSLASPIMSLKFDVRKLELIELTAQFVSTSVMLIWAWFYPSIWPLVVSGLTSAIISTFSSYYFFPFRHHLVWDKAIVKEVFHFSKWIVIASALTYLFSQSDKLFFAGKITAAQLGVYSIAFMLVGTLTSITQMLAERIVFPVFAGLVHGDRKLLKNKYYKVRLYLDSPIFLAAGLLVALGPTIVSILYDSRYSDAGWMFQILIVSVIGHTLSLVSMECLSALSITQVRMWVMLIRTVALFIGLPIAYNFYGFNGAIWVIAINVWLSLPLVYWTLAKNSVFSFYKEVRMLPIILVGYVLGITIVSFI